jgi:uncharacterized protein (TIGR03437 family)
MPLLDWQRIEKNRGDMKLARLCGLFLALIGIGAAQQPTVNQNGVVNAASYSVNNPRGSLVTIFGTNMTSCAGLLVASSTPLTTQIQGCTNDTVSATVNGISAPMFYASSTQTSVQIPWATATGTANIAVKLNGNVSPTQPFHVTTFSPGIFTINAAGTGMTWAINAVTGTVAQPSQGWPFPTIKAAPAQAGDHLYIYATGLGPVSPTIRDGAAPCPLSGCPAGVKLSTTTTQPTVMIGGVAATVEFSGLAPQFVGVYQVNFKVPTGVTPGSAVTLQLQIGSPPVSSNNVTLAIQ